MPDKSPHRDEDGEGVADLGDEVVQASMHVGAAFSSNCDGSGGCTPMPGNDVVDLAIEMCCRSITIANEDPGEPR